MIPDYSKHLVGQGLSSVFLNGTTGQSTSLTVDERKSIVEAWMKTDAVRDRKLRVINHVGGNSINEMIDLAQHSEAQNVDAISAFNPCYYKPKNFQEVAEMCIVIAQASPKTPFMFYYFPAMNGIVVPVYDTLKLANEYAPNVVGVKFTDAKYSDARLISDAGFNVCVGAAEVFNSALVSGAHGLIGTMNNWSGHLHKNIYTNFHTEGKRHLADKYAAHSCIMAKAIESTGNVFSGRAYMFEKRTGFDLGHYRYPLHNLDDAHRKKLDEFIASYDFNPTFE